MAPELKDIVFLDIETIGMTDRYNDLSERFKTQWARKASFLKREEGQTDEDLFYERAGIYAEFGKVIVIAVGKYAEDDKGELTIKTKTFSGHDERTVLNEFRLFIEKADPARTKLCAHNGKEFDFPYLCRRMLVNHLQLPPLLNIAGLEKWKIPHLDTMEMWKFGDYKHYTSLDLLLALFDIPSSKEHMDGSMVNEVYYKEKDLARISNYCVADVIAVAQLYLRMKGHPVTTQQNLQF